MDWWKEEVTSEDYWTLKPSRRMRALTELDERLTSGPVDDSAPSATSSHLSGLKYPDSNPDETQGFHMYTRQYTPREYSSIKNMSEPEWETRLTAHKYATEPKLKPELPYLPETSFFDETLD